MKRVLFSFSFLCIVALTQAQLTQQSVVTASNGTIYFYQFKPPTYRSGSPKNPLIISLAGVGEQGNGSSSDLLRILTGGIPKKINDSKTNMVFTYNGYTDGFIVLAPQIPQGTNWSNYYVDEMINYGIANLNVDPQRIFLTGYSLGATGTIQYAITSTTNASKLAGIAPIAGGDPGGGYCNIASQQLAMWGFQAADDNVYGNGIQSTASNINACGTLIIPAIATTFPGTVHGAQVWDDLAYDLTNNTHEPNLYQWMLKVSKALNPSTNQNPTAVATMSNTNNLTLTAPQSFKNLSLLVGDASSDPDDIIVDYLWTQTAGKSVYFGTSPYSPSTEQRTNTTIVDPSNHNRVDVGDYQFNLRVRDYLTSKPGHTQNAVINLHVVYPASGHAGPVLDAGGYITISTDNYTKYYPPGIEPYPCSQCQINGYSWSIISFPAGTSPSLRSYNDVNVNYSGSDGGLSFANLTKNGEYKFQFKATTTGGDISTDILTINRINGALPVNYAYVNAVNAGNNNLVTWATTSEINSDRFDVQRSIDGLSYSTIGSVKSTGSASITTAYSFTDENAPAGLSYYRLSQVDLDGKTSLSKVVSVNNKKTGIYVERYPNPAHESLNVTVQSITNGAMQVVIADMQGKTLIQQQWQKDQTQLKKVLNVNTLKAGMYQMVITIGQERKVSSFVKY